MIAIHFGSLKYPLKRFKNSEKNIKVIYDRVSTVTRAVFMNENKTLVLKNVRFLHNNHCKAIINKQ